MSNCPPKGRTPFKKDRAKTQSSVLLDHTDTFMRTHLGQGKQMLAQEMTCRTTLKRLINIISNNHWHCAGLHSQLPALSTFQLHLGLKYSSLCSKGKGGKLGKREGVTGSFVWTDTTGVAAEQMLVANGRSRSEQCFSLLPFWWASV